MIWKAGIWKKNTMYFTLVILQSSIEKTNHVQVIPTWYHPKTLLFCELLALTRWPHIFLYFSLTECQKSCSHPMTPHFLSLCSHRMPQPVGGRALHPYPLHIWLPPPPGPLHVQHTYYRIIFKQNPFNINSRGVQRWSLTDFRLKSFFT